MATKKGKRSTASKKFATDSTNKQTNSSTKVKHTKAKVVAEDLVEVAEVEAPVTKAANVSKEDTKKATFAEMLAALNPAALIAELLGTFVLTALIIKLSNNTYFGILGIALGYAMLVLIFNKVSKAHLNPAISIAQWINRKINGVTAVAYVVAQVLGAILAFFVLTSVNNASYDYDAAIRQGIQKAGVTESVINKAGGYEKWLASFGGKDAVAGQLGISKEAPKIYHANALNQGKEAIALLVEIMGATIFGFAVAYAVRQKDSLKAGFAIGFGLMAGLMVAGATAILNPAVASALGVFTGESFASVVWTIAVYMLAPIVGVSLGIAVYNLLHKNTCDCE